MDDSKIERVYYIPADGNGASVPPGILINLNPDGSANLSRLPESVRSHLERFGMQDRLRTNPVLPSEGRRFLQALVQSRNPYMRFQRNPLSVHPVTVH